MVTKLAAGSRHYSSTKCRAASKLCAVILGGALVLGAVGTAAAAFPPNWDVTEWMGASPGVPYWLGAEFPPGDTDYTQGRASAALSGTRLILIERNGSWDNLAITVPNYDFGTGGPASMYARGGCGNSNATPVWLDCRWFAYS